MEEDIQSKNTRRPDKRCPNCGIFKSYSNFSTHYKKCIDINEKNQLMVENLNLKKINEDLLLKIKEQETQISDLNSIIASKDEKLDPITINEVIYSRSYATQLAYSKIWNRYIKWCKYENIDSSAIRSVQNYFRSIQHPKLSSQLLKPTSLNQVSSVLRSLFKKIYSKDISAYLPKRYGFQQLRIKPKYTMTTDEIKAFLKSQIYNLQNFLSCYILIFSGCRVHTLSTIKPEDYENGTFYLFDSKTQKNQEFVLSKTIKQIMTSYFKNNCHKPFLFFSQDLNLSMDSRNLVTLRGGYVCSKIKKIIRNCKVFAKVDTKRFSLGSHIFRTTKVHQCISKFKEMALSECRKSINHSDKSYSIKFYTPKDIEVPLFMDLIDEIDYLIQNDEEWKEILNNLK